MGNPGILNDILFKVVFGSQSSEPILRALLNALLKLEGPARIEELTLLNPVIGKEFFSDKSPILDLKARDKSGHQYNVEVQHYSEVEHYLKRSFYYGCKFYAGQIQQGEDSHKQQKTVCLSILDFILFPESQQLHHVFKLYDQDQSIVLEDLLQLHFVELRKFQADEPRDLWTPFERWLFFLKFSNLYHDNDLPDFLKAEEGIPMALEAMRHAYSKRCAE